MGLLMQDLITIAAATEPVNLVKCAELVSVQLAPVHTVVELLALVSVHFLVDMIDHYLKKEILDFHFISVQFQFNMQSNLYHEIQSYLLNIVNCEPIPD